MLNRRQFLGAVMAGAITAGCSPAIDYVERPRMPSRLRSLAPDPVVHLLNRATFGPRPNEAAHVREMGAAEWLDRQLDPASIPDDDVALRLRRYDTLEMQPRDLLSFGRLPDKQFVADELVAATIVRALYSERQLYEVMVNFWSDHFSIYHLKDGATVLKTVDDRDVIRPNALGYFGDMLRASAHSPAMLVYLDNVINERSHPNENYAREIMELHTLGVNGGYTEKDVLDVARCFTGWTVNRRGEFEYRADWHDDGEKIVLGHHIPAGGGKADGNRVLSILLDHPSTARYVSSKLVRRFIADDPPESVVRACAATWRATNGDIRAVLRTLFASEAFATAPPKLKRPYEFAISLLRATNATYNGTDALLNRLQGMGQRPFDWPTPDGYPDTAVEWSGGLVQRWNMSMDVTANRVRGVRVPVAAWAQRFGSGTTVERALDMIAMTLLQRPLELPEQEAILAAIADEKRSADVRVTDVGNLLGTVLASPAFQWR